MSCEDLCVVQEAGEGYSAYLVDQPGALFVDTASVEDPYPTEMWAALAVYFESTKDMRPSTGRYEFAKALMQFQLPCLAQRSLGQVCHIVSLAIFQRRLLGYAKAQVVPFSRSDECTKKRRALNELPMSSSGLPVATMEEACWGLSALLRSPGAKLALARVKEAFRTHFFKELSETALGHDTLRGLLLDARLHGVCTVSGDFVLPASGRSVPIRPPPGL